MQKIGIISQKGGVGKSTLARLIAVNYSAAKSVKIADMDLAQGTCVKWNARRMQSDLKPLVSVEYFKTVISAVMQCENFDILIFDGRPHASPQSLEIAKASDLIIIPTGTAIDDLEPGILLAHELAYNKIDTSKITFALTRIGTSKSELAESRQYIKNAGYFALEGEMFEKTAIRRASDTGLCANETPYNSVNEKCNILLGSIIERLEKS